MRCAPRRTRAKPWEAYLNRKITDSRAPRLAADIALRQKPASIVSSAPVQDAADTDSFHDPGRDAWHVPARADAHASKTLAGMASYLHASWSGAALLVKTTLAEAQKIPFSGVTLTGDDHLVGFSHAHAPKPTRIAEGAKAKTAPGTDSAASRLSDHWHQDMRAIQNTSYYKTYQYTLLASRILTGSLSPLQAGVCIGAAALPVIDANFPAASEPARHALMAASIVADPFGFAAGTATLVAVRLAMQQASPDRRAFWQCMTFLLSRQLTTHALTA